jgi:hypothetical protein
VNEFIIEGDIARIKLTQGKETIVSKKDLEKALQIQWAAARNRKRFRRYKNISLAERIKIFWKVDDSLWASQILLAIQHYVGDAKTTSSFAKSVKS